MIVLADRDDLGRLPDVTVLGSLYDLTARLLRALRQPRGSLL